jgi:hypothetical protein
MSTNVFANGKEVAAKKSDNQSIAAMPDVCLSPPSPPAGPIPIPYPNFSAASDMAEGTKTVKIAGDEVGMKDQSNYKTSKGDEAATKSLGMGVVTHGIQGKTFFAAWSSDVMFEGANAVRFMDMTTGNHSSDPPNSADTTVCTGTLAPPGGDPECVELENAARDAAANDTVGGNLPDDAALVTAKHSGGRTFKALQPGDLVKSSKQSGYSQPHGKSTLTCTGTPYNPNDQGNRDHSECKIMEDLWGSGSGPGPGGSLSMRVNWNDGGSLSDSPCGQCKGSICKTALACKIEIYICKGDADKMEKKKAPCKTINHKDGTVSHVWDSKLWKN